MKRIIEKYYLLETSELVHYQEGTNGVDCWFDTTNNIRQHRCLSLDDFSTIVPIDGDWECSEGTLHGFNDICHCRDNESL